MAKQKSKSQKVIPATGALKLAAAAPEIRIERSSGNVFADLGLPDAAELDTKVRLAVAINDRISGRHLSQAKAAGLLGVNQPKISALKNYRLEGFSVERLMTFLTALGSDIEIRIRSPKRASATQGRILVEAA